jgi:hypothetical protein
MTHDESNLHLLAILYYFAAGLFAVLLVVALLCLAAGILAMLGLLGGGSSAPVVGIVLIAAAVAGILVNVGAGTIFYLAGGCIERCCHYNFCVVAAGVSCLFFPPGAILGVYSLSVLMRPSVRQKFGISGGAPEAAAGEEGPGAE